MELNHAKPTHFFFSPLLSGELNAARVAEFVLRFRAMTPLWCRSNFAEGARKRTKFCHENFWLSVTSTGTLVHFFWCACRNAARRVELGPRQGGV
mmetsp:Transcript_3420/g.8641  ORF Transcript_3420/g.8641 Transcript_3420/m.8641 type:complete len:95 (-) Transcript_3420:148-432(-)